MEDDISPIIQTKKKAAKKTAAKKTSTRKKEAPLKKRESLEDVPELYEEISNIVSSGHRRSEAIAVLLGTTPEKFMDFREEYPEKVDEAIRYGKVLFEITLTNHLVDMARGNFTAAKYLLDGTAMGGDDLPTDMELTEIKFNLMDHDGGDDV